MTVPSTSTQTPVVLDHQRTLVVVIELSLKSWLVAALVPGVERRLLGIGVALLGCGHQARVIAG